LKNADSDEPTITTQARRRADGKGVWRGAWLVLALTLAGLGVSTAVIWFQVVEGANQRHHGAVAARSADLYAGLFDARIAELRTQLQTAAAAPETVEAAISLDDARIDAAGRALTAILPFADRVEVFTPGSAEVDLNAPVPITFAALAVIRQAESRDFVGPEGIRIDDHRSRLHAAAPITSEGRVAGVLFAALSAEYLLAPLRSFDASSGALSLEQRFEGTQPVTLLQWGDPSPATAPVAPQRRTLSAPHWQLVFHGRADAAGTVAEAADLLTAMAVTAALLLAAVLFAFSTLARQIQRDAGALLEQASNSLRGRPQTRQRYRLSVFEQLAREIGRMAGTGRMAGPGDDAKGGTKEPEAPAPAARSQRPRPRPRAEGADAAAAAEATPAKASGTARTQTDDYLEVRSSTTADDNFGIEVTEDNSPLAMGLSLEPEIFRSYDIRGITTTNLTEEVVYWIGRAFAAEARERGQGRAAIGRDGRHSSAPLAQSLTRGLAEGGLDVLDIGEVPTPVLYYATYALDTGTGIMITGSHNPPEYNGLKMVMAGETLAEDRIQALRARIEENRLSDGDGDVERIDIGAQYIDRIVDDVVVAQPLKVVVDCGNGVAGTLAPELIRQLGCEVIPLYCDVDGDFPNHHPDPAEPENLQDLITVVRAEGADLGLAFDGDGDRLGVITPRGEIIWPDKLLMLYAQDIVGRNPGADIIYDVKCSRHLNGLISDLGGRPIMWKTGHSHIKAKLKETGALLAGEFSGHIVFGERWYGFDDALYAAARLLEILGSAGQNADELFAQFPVTWSTPELKIKTTEKAKFEIMQRLVIDGDFGDGTLTTIDGVRVDYPDGWGLIRPSNTSPVLSLRFEADSADSLERIQTLFQRQLTAIDPELRFR
jgi:phosphomannomutase / phosphoglucomutase